MAATRWDVSRLKGVRDGTDTQYLTILDRSVRGCAVVGARALGPSVGPAIFEDVCQELWIFLYSKLDTLHPDAPLEPYLIAAAKLIAMATARKLFPLAEKSFDEGSEGDADADWQNDRAQFAAINDSDGASLDSLVGIGSGEGESMMALDAALSYSDSADAPSSSNDEGIIQTPATSKLRASPSSVADIEARIDREKALQLLTRKSHYLRELSRSN